MKQFWLNTAAMTDGELVDLIHELSNELEGRIRSIKTGSWLNDQLDGAQLEVRSWSFQKQRNMRFE